MNQVMIIRKQKERDPYFDNARFLLVCLVVFGHMISPVRTDHDLIYSVNNFLSLFRMPALIIVTGFLAKSFYKEGYIGKIVKKILLPYLLFQAIFAYYYFHLYDKNNFNLDLFMPQYTLWFLLSLFFWNLLLFIFTKMKHPLLVAVLLGVGAGYIEDAGHYFSIQRTFVFFPFFLLGYYLKKEHFKWVQHRISKALSIVGFILVFYMMDQFALSDARAWVLGMRSYAEMGYEAWYTGGMRLLFYTLSLIVGFSFLAWVPTTKQFFTKLGSRTAYIYILHGAIIRTIYEYVWVDEFTTLGEYLMLPVYALLLAIFLGSTPVKVVLQPLIECSLSDWRKPFEKIRSKKREDVNSSV
jgi:fucose 4-O-acetylase-like acetyltransferase